MIFKLFFGVFGYGFDNNENREEFVFYKSTDG